MKVLLSLSFALLACLVGGARAQRANDPLVQLASQPIHQLFNQLRNILESYSANVTFLQLIDINHTLERLLSYGEKQLKDLLFNEVVPAGMELLHGPALQLRGLLQSLRSYLETLNVKSLMAQVPVYITTAKKTVDMVLTSLDKVLVDYGVATTRAPPTSG